MFINNLDFEKPIYEHIILGRSLNDVLRKYQIYEGDLLRVELNLRTLVSNIIPLTDLLGLLKLKQNLELLEKFFSKIYY